MRAVFVAEVLFVRVADHAPVLVGNDILKGNVVFLHQLGGELGGACDGCSARIPGVFAHFDTDGFSVSGAFVVGVLSLHVGGEGLVDGVIVYSKVPGEVAQGVVLGLESTTLNEFGVGSCACSRGVILGGVNGNVARPQTVRLVAPIFSFWDELLADAQTGVGKIRTAAPDGDEEGEPGEKGGEQEGDSGFRGHHSIF